MTIYNNCNDILELLNRFLDNELDPGQYSLVKSHIENCNECARELESFREVDAIGKAEVFPDPGVSVWNDQRQKIANSIKADSNVKIARKTFSIHWTERVFGSVGLRTAVGLSAAAIIILFITKDVYRDDTVFEFTGGVTSELPKPAKDIPEFEQKPVTNLVRDEVSKKEIQELTPSNSQIKEDHTATIENVEKIDDKSVSESNEQTMDPVMETQSEQAKESKTVTRIPAAPIDRKNDLERVPVIVGPMGKSPVKTEAGIDIRSSLDMRNQNPPLIQNKATDQTSEKDFNSYLDAQSSINSIQNPLVRKDRWIAYLADVKDKVVRDLIVYDIYEIYNFVVKPDSQAELKKEALEFLVENRESIEKIIGKEIFEKRLEQFKKLN